jgi:RimJ/RimL family protein N-acetyltransferase
MKNIDYSNYYWQNELVRLRAPRSDDWEEHYYAEFDSTARRRLEYEIELPPTEQNTKSAFDSVQQGRIFFTIETLDSTAVGGVNLNSIDERNGTFSVGMQIYPDHRNKGYGTAAMRLILKYAFEERRLHKYYGSVIEDNVASSAMLTKLGCVREGVRREQIFMNGRYWDEILYGLTDCEFNRNKK